MNARQDDDADGHTPISGLPAKPLTTALEWEDLGLDEAVREDVSDIVTWVRHSQTLMEDWGLGRRIKPGMRCLFHGAPGTGKTLTAALIGKVTGREVYRVDLSAVISKYIGETEKNLAELFDLAAKKEWILFFDEADAVFGKRTEARDSHDRYANLEVNYLLQRMEDFAGVVIIASNVQSNIDEAFARRFQSIIHFAMPDAGQRLRLWNDAFAGRELAPDVDFRKLAKDHELTGGGIVEVLRFASIRAIQRDPTVIQARDIVDGIRRQFRPEMDSHK